MSSNLTALLQYRFVKRDGSSSDSSSQGTATQSPSQSSTQPPSTQPTSPQPPGTPDGKKPSSNSVTPVSKTTVPKTALTSPDSPIFSTRPKLVNRNWGFTPEKDSSSSAPSPWLSKENGILSNGKKSTTSSRRLPNLSDEDSDDDADVGHLENFNSNLTKLSPLFPGKSRKAVRKALLDSEGDIEKAIDKLIERKTTTKFKRIRRDSTSEGDSPEKPLKRARILSNVSSEEVIVLDSDVDESQQTVSYTLDSQRSDLTEIYEVNNGQVGEELDDTALNDDQKKKIKFLSDCFKDKSSKELHRVLKQHDWNVADATVVLSSCQSSLKAVATETRDKAKAANSNKKRKGPDVEIDDEDDDFGSGGESEGSDDSIEEEGDEAKRVIIDFFEDATVEELMATPGCSKKKSELIISSRPFKTWATLTEKFVSVKGLSYELISGCREVIKIREVVKRLMERCEKIVSSMEKVVSHLINSNTQLDDDNVQITIQPANLNPDLQLKPFQMVGLNWLRVMHQQDLNGILADEMGLGKTIQTISFLAHLLEEGENGPHVIIVPSSTIDNWIRECKTWCPSLKILVYYGSQEDRRATRQYILYNSEEEFNVIITTYNMATGSFEDRALFKRFEFHYAIFDEGHLLKNMSSLRYQNLMRITAHRRLLLTGTPLQNNLLELMSLLCFVMPDIFIGKTEQLKRMFTMISRGGNDEGRSRYEQDRIAHAKRIMKPFVLRRLKSEVMSQLPRKIEAVESCAMIPSQQELYDRLIRNFANQMTDEGEEVVIGGGSFMLMQLRKAANHPLLHRSHYTDKKIKEMAKVLCEEASHKERGALPELVVEDMQVMSDFEIHKCCQFYREHLGKYCLKNTMIDDSGKFRVLDKKLDEYSAEGHRVLLFSQFTTMLDIMEVYLTKKGIRYLRLDGSTPVVERQKLIDEYNKDTGIFVFLLSTKAGGLGINLTSANVVILHDIDFNPYNDKQAEDRCHRVGQTRQVHILRLIGENTVEEAMLKCAGEKLKLEKDVISTDEKDNEPGTKKDVASILKQALAARSALFKS